MECSRSDSAAINEALSRTDTLVISAENPRTGGNVYIIDSPIVLTSGKTVILDGCILRLADGVYSNIFMSINAHGEQTAADTLHDIRIIGRNGATLDGGAHNGLTEKTMLKNGLPHVLYNTFIYLRNVTCFEVSGLILSRLRYWGATFAYCSNGSVKDLCFDAQNDAPNQDGIDCRVGCHDIVVENISGRTGDDCFAATALLWDRQIEGLSPDIHHITVRNFCVECTGGHGLIRLLNQDGIKLHDILIENIYDTSIDSGGRSCFAAVRIGDSGYSKNRLAMKGETYGITVRNVLTAAAAGIKIGSDSVTGLFSENIQAIKSDFVF